MFDLIQFVRRTCFAFVRSCVRSSGGVGVKYLSESSSSSDEVDSEEYDVNEILDRRFDDKYGVFQYFVSWKNYGREHDSWIDAHATGCPHKVAEFQEVRYQRDLQIQPSDLVSE